MSRQMISFLLIFKLIMPLQMLAMGCATTAFAATDAELNVDIQTAIKRYYDEIRGGKNLAYAAEGMLVFPNVDRKGDESYGEGALLIDGVTVDYYSVNAASGGAGEAADERSFIILFLDKTALEGFRSGSGWTADAEGSIAAVDVGIDEVVERSKYHRPIIGFVFGEAGPVFDASFEGVTFTKLNTEV